MKLYATTTSERASKGQGGNWLKIKICNEKEQELCRIYVEMINNQPVVQLWDMNQKMLEFIPTKGKQEKGECQHEWRKMDNDVYYCQNCQATKDSDGGIID
jgi:hypothetical protein